MITLNPPFPQWRQWLGYCKHFSRFAMLQIRSLCSETMPVRNGSESSKSTLSAPLSVHSFYAASFPPLWVGRIFINASWFCYKFLIELIPSAECVSIWNLAFGAWTLSDPSWDLKKRWLRNLLNLPYPGRFWAAVRQFPVSLFGASCEGRYRYRWE